MLGSFITFEGPEGSGKTTLIKHINEYVSSLGYETIVTREPGGINIAEQIRGVILDKENIEMDARTEALLYAAARRQHLVEKVIPALKSGKVVLCDRFIDSSLAYQGFARGIGIQNVLNINEFAIDGLYPHMTLYLDLDPYIGLERINQDKNREINRLDNEELQFHEKVRAGYKMLVSQHSKRIKEINANQTVERVVEDAKTLIGNYFKEVALFRDK